MIDFDEIDDLLGLQRFAAARAYISEAVPGDAVEARRLELRRLQLTSPGAADPQLRLDIDSYALAIDEIASDPDLSAEGAAYAWSFRLQPALMRRTRAEAERVVARMEERVGREHNLSLVARASICMVFDEREQVKELLEHALVTDPHPRVNRAMAGLLYVVGDFAGARAHASALEGTRYWLTGCHLLAMVASAEGDLESEATALSAAIDLAPDGEAAAGLHAARAASRAGLGLVAGAREDYVAALAGAPDEFREEAEEYIRHRLDAADAAGADVKRARLDAFPSVVQKWNYCGPAVIELCLRYAGVEMSQDVIADAVKEPSGTSMYAIVEFLRRHGMEVRRIEATAERVHSAIDLGFPVILEDDYVNSAHVSVAIGYDDRFGVLIVADPMTHAPRNRAIESRATTAGDLRYGGVLVMGREDDVTPEMRRRADEAGLVEAPHIALLDQASRAFDGAEGPFRKPLAIEAAGMAAEVLSLEPRFPQASLMWVASLLNAGPNGWSSRVREAMWATRAQLPRMAEIRSASATAHLNSGRIAHAIVDAAEAVATEPFDARARALLGQLLADAGEREEAFSHLTRAIALAPSQPEATIALASLLRDELAERFIGQQEAADGTLRFAFTPPSRPSAWAAFDDSTLLALARRVAGIAAEMSPESGLALLARADVATIEGEIEEALTLLDGVEEREPGWALPILRRASIAASTRRAAPLEAAAQRALRAAWDGPEFWERMVQCLNRAGKVARAEEVARRSVDTCASKYRPLQLWLGALRARTRSEGDAARAVVALATERAHDDAFLQDAVRVLEVGGLRGHAVALLRAALENNPDDAQSAYRLATIIRRSPAHRDEAVGLLRRALRAAPWAVDLHMDLAWLLLGAGPQEALGEIGEYPRPTLMSLEPKRRALLALGRADEAGAVAAEMATMAGGSDDARLHVGYALATEGLSEFVSETVPEGEPSWDDLVAVARWTTVYGVAGRADRAVSALREHPEVLRDPDVARAAARLSPVHDPVFSAMAMRAHAADSPDIEQARFLEVRARCAVGEWAGILDVARTSTDALAKIAEDAEDPALCAKAIALANALAPNDRAVLAARETVMLLSGDIKGARAAAEQLDRDFPFEHQGAERLAEIDALEGRLDEALDHALSAVSEGSTCGQAASTLAFVYALRGEWNLAEGPARGGFALRWSTRPYDLSEVMLAAVERDVPRVQASAKALAAAYPKAPHLAVMRVLLAGAPGEGSTP